jgi:hypothetical protein
MVPITEGLIQYEQIEKPAIQLNAFNQHQIWPTMPFLCSIFAIYCDVLPKKPAYQRFVARQQLRKYARVLEPLLGSSPHATMEVQLEAVFSMWSAPSLYHSINRVPNSSVSSR